MKKIPQTKKELEDAIKYLIEFFDWLDKPISEDKCFGFFVNEHPTIFTITFVYVVENISQPIHTPPDEIIESKSDEYPINILKESTMQSLISGVEYVIDQINSFKVITDISELEAKNDD